MSAPSVLYSAQRGACQERHIAASCRAGSESKSEPHPFLKGDGHPYDVKLGIQRALTEELGSPWRSYASLDGGARGVSRRSADPSNATPEDMATLFQSQQEAQLLTGKTHRNKTSKPLIPVDDERAEVISGLQNHFFEKISEASASRKEAWQSSRLTSRSSCTRRR